VTSDRTLASRRERLTRNLARAVDLARVVGDAQPTEIEEAARRLGSARRYLAPVAWAGGALVLLVRGIRLLVLNWRLTLVQLVPAVWIWITMWELKQHSLRGAPFRDLSLGSTVALSLIAIGASIAAFWCNTVFAYAIDTPQPRIAPAARKANLSIHRIVAVGMGVGAVLAAAAVVVPRTDRLYLYIATLGATLALMFATFVAVPARIVGARRQKLAPRQALGSWAAASALSAVAMTPGFVLDRVGLILMGVRGLHVIGFILLSVGTALYAAGMSSVRAVKLTMKLGPGDPGATAPDDDPHAAGARPGGTPAPPR
jgi:hypothetical protein